MPVVSVSVEVPASIPLGLPAEGGAAGRRCYCIASLLAWTASIHGVLAGLGIDDPDIRGDLAVLAAEAMRSAGMRYSREALAAIEGKKGWLPDLIEALGEEGVAELIDAFISAARRGDDETVRRVAWVVLDSMPGGEEFRVRASRIIERGGFDDVVALVSYMLFLEPCEG